MQAEFLRRLLEDHTGRFDRHGRKRVWLSPRRLERIRARQSRDADLIFRFLVVRLQVGIGDGPVRETGAGDCAEATALDEVALVEPPVISREMD